MKTLYGVFLSLGAAIGAGLLIGSFLSIIDTIWQHLHDKVNEGLWATYRRTSLFYDAYQPYFIMIFFALFFFFLMIRAKPDEKGSK